LYLRRNSSSERNRSASRSAKRGKIPAQRREEGRKDALGILRRTRELAALLDDLFDGVEEVALGRDFAPRSDGEHASFGRDGAELGSGRVGAQSGDEIESDVLLDGHSGG
jgi:hypothetical protein